MNTGHNEGMLRISKINMAISIVVLVSASFVTLQNAAEGKPYYEHMPFVMLGLILLASSYMNAKRIKAESEGKMAGDERSRRAVEKGGFFAFLLLAAMLMVSGVANSAFDLGLEYTMTVNVILFACVFAWMGIAHYFDRRGG